MTTTEELIRESRRAIEECIASCDQVLSRGGHRHWRGRDPFGIVRVGKGKTRRGMFLLARFEHLLEIGREDLI